jgi:lipoprotein-anchoring transpeptidase ErfK/SrfK
MPFNGGIGLHDATWRSSFGGNIYKTNGSHGCVNMPLQSAKKVYENITNTMPIIVW